MKIFLDTADLEQIELVSSWGILDGVTTNPTHVSKTGKSPRELYPEICAKVAGPVSLETVGLDADTIVKEGRALAKIANNVVVKVPLMKEGLIAVKRLAAEGIHTNVTVTFSPLQALLAAKVGATYISPFVGRLDYVGHRGIELAEQIRTIYDNYDYKTEIIVAAIRNPIHVLDAALAGCEICTMSYEVLSMLYDHPLTDIGIQTFLKDWEKVPK
ncbi:MAG TPA: fructose-6-phosphate aldolase [Spirochaetia bacterium]|nr:fructose-6-phosphate aldolase [Spirochaetia bacterium]